MGLAVLRQAPAEGVVAVVRLQAFVFVVRQPVEQVPGVAALLAVVPANAEVAPCVVLLVADASEPRCIVLSGHITIKNIDKSIE